MDEIIIEYNQMEALKSCSILINNKKAKSYKQKLMPWTIELSWMLRIDICNNLKEITKINITKIIDNICKKITHGKI